MDLMVILVGVALLAGLYLAFTIGANDVANTMGTAVGSRALNLKQALVVAAVFEFAGAFLIGDQVTETIKSGFVDPGVFQSDPMSYAFGMTAAILATAFWLQFASMRGVPVSTTHSIVGAVFGFAIIEAGLGSIDFRSLIGILVSWIISPILGGLISYFTFRIILRFIIDAKNPLRRAKRIVPLLTMIVVGILSSAFLPKVLLRFGVHDSAQISILISILVGAIFMAIFYVLISKKIQKYKDREEVIHVVEHIFGRVQWVTACFLAFAHGSNDVANAIGPASAVVATLQNQAIDKSVAVPFWLLAMGGGGIVLGLVTFGRKVIQTVGQKITEITPTRGFSAEFSAALTILLGTVLGIPLSTTHILVGAVIGVGLARGIAGIDVGVIRRIFRSWVVTIPITTFLSMAFCYGLKLLS